MDSMELLLELRTQKRETLEAKIGRAHSLLQAIARRTTDQRFSGAERLMAIDTMATDAIGTLEEADDRQTGAARPEEAR
jgi:hypothetical protein